MLTFKKPHRRAGSVYFMFSPSGLHTGVSALFLFSRTVYHLEVILNLACQISGFWQAWEPYIVLTPIIRTNQYFTVLAGALFWGLLLLQSLTIMTKSHSKMQKKGFWYVLERNRKQQGVFLQYHSYIMKIYYIITRFHLALWDSPAL